MWSNRPRRGLSSRCPLTIELWPVVLFRCRICFEEPLRLCRVPVASSETATRARHLTTQPFLPKLILNKHMQAKTHRIRILAVLLSVIFLGAQFHFCADLTVAPSASHICPVCSATCFAIAAQSPSIAIVPVTLRLAAAPLIVSVFSAVPRAISPRAPPAL